MHCAIPIPQADLDIVHPASLTHPRERLLAEAEVIKCAVQVGFFAMPWLDCTFAMAPFADKSWQSTESFLLSVFSI